MDNVETITLKVPAVRAMTRKQFRQMKEAGFDPLKVDQEEQASSTLDMFDWILDNIYPDHDFDEYPNGECMRLAADTFKLAMGQPTEEAKNS
jgi:hypothetical protein